MRAAITEETKIIGFGEAHAPEDFDGRSTVRRFAEDLLPALAPLSSALLVELLAPPQGCEGARATVQKESDAVTQGQSKANQNEYVALGHLARRHGVTPDILRPSCEDMKAIQQSDSPVVTMMETIAQLSAREAPELVGTATSERPLVILYGGALHNDVEPREELASWSYGPHLAKATNGHYLEIDLVVPGLMQATDSWKKFRWYDAAASLPAGHGPVLIQLDARSFALVFEREITAEASSAAEDRASPPAD